MIMAIQYVLIGNREYGMKINGRMDIEQGGISAVTGQWSLA